MRAMGIAPSAPTYRVGKPYPPAFDIPRYPPTYSVPLFSKFSGNGSDESGPLQHINHYMIQCGDSAREDAFLCRQFSRSLSGPAFDWYCSLEPGSIQSWDQMVRAFTSRFATTTNRVRLADLAWAKQKPNESLLNRWRNLSIKSSHPVPEKEAVDLLVRSTTGKMRQMLTLANPSSYQELVDTVSRLGQAETDETSTSSFRPKKDFPKKNESKAVYAVKTNENKNEGADSSDEEARRVDNRQAQPAFRGNQNNRYPKTLEEQRNKKYS